MYNLGCTIATGNELDLCRAINSANDLLRSEETELSSMDEVQPPAFDIKIDWNAAAQTKTLQHANQAVIQLVEHEINLTFFQYSVPVAIGSASEVLMQLQGIKILQPDCIARINISPRTARGLIKAIQQQLDENDKLEKKADEQ